VAASRLVFPSVRNVEQTVEKARVELYAASVTTAAQPLSDCHALSDHRERSSWAMVAKLGERRLRRQAGRQAVGK